MLHFCGELTLPPPRHRLCSLPAELLVPLQQQHLNSAADNDTPQSRQHQELHTDWAPIQTRPTCTSAGPYFGRHWGAKQARLAGAIRPAMPSDEYKSAGGGALRIKGAKVKKHKKKKDKSALEKNLAEPKKEEPQDKEGSQEAEEAQEDEPSRSHKTDAERRFEEARRKRLLEKAESSRPELLKTHKERVEELNTYLSKLSEHHDMPKIGPG